MPDNAANHEQQFGTRYGIWRVIENLRAHAVAAHFFTTCLRCVCAPRSYFTSCSASVVSFFHRCGEVVYLLQAVAWGPFIEEEFFFNAANGHAGTSMYLV